MGRDPWQNGVETEELFRALFEQALDGMLLADVETKRFVRANRQIQQLLGYTEEELLQLGVQDIHPAESLPAVFEQFAKQVRGEITLGEDVPVRRKDGRLFYADIRTTLISVGANNYLLGMFRDITETKRVERALRDSELKHRTLFETADEAIMLMDRDRFIDCNVRTLALFGCRRDQMVGESPYRFSPPTQPDGRDSREKALEKIGKALSEGPQTFEWEHSRADGSTFSAEVSLNSLKLGGTTLLQAIVRDISSRKRNEAALKESLFFLTKAQEVAHLGSYTYNLVTGLWTSSPQLDAIFGIGPDHPRDLAGWLDLVDPDQRRQMAHYLVHHVLDERQRFDREYRIIRAADRQPRWVSGMGELTCDADGKPLLMIGTIQDVTERKEWQDRLQQTARELARSNKDLEQFAYVASHDLKEPLRMVTGFMSLLRDRYQDRLDSQGLEYIAFAQEGGARMQRLVDDLLAYSRVGRNARIESVDVGAAVDEALKNLKSGIAETGAVIRRDPLPVIQSNPLELVQIFQNLIGNAIKFRREGVAPEIHVGARREADDWVFQVRDNGIGIPPEQRQKVFLIFNRMHGRDKFPGTGIGLAICKKIVERHGGKIWVEPNEDEGSVFCFTLPSA